MPQYNDYTIDTLLTNMSIGYTNDSLIGEQLFPSLEVASRTGFYFTFDKSKFRIEDSRRTGLSRANRVGFGMTKTAFGPLAEQSLEEALEYEVRDTYPTPMDARADSTDDVTEHLALGLEKEIADKLTATATVTNNTTLAGTDQFSDFANSDPFAVIQAGIDVVQNKGLVTPNVCAMGYQVWSKLKNHPDLLGRLSVNTVRTLTPQLFAEIFGFEKVLIGKAQYNSAVEGQADSLSYVWGKDIVICFVPPTPKIKSLATGYTLRVKGARYVDRWDEPAVKAEFVRANDYYEPKFVSADAAYLIKAAIA